MRNLGWMLTLALLFGFAGRTSAGHAAEAFRRGVAAYEQKDFSRAAELFTQSISNEPAAGAFQNLGNAEWEQGHTAAAVLAWERALSLNPFDRNSENNLKFARDAAQLESPELTWCEIASTWLPASWWAWLAGGSLWFAVGMMLLPGILRWRKSATHQAWVALGLGVLLLASPANYGVWTRANLGFALESETPLRLTPTAEGEPATKLAAGEPGRVRRETEKYLLIETRRASGWLKRGEFRLICPR